MSIRSTLATGLQYLATRLTDPHGRAVVVPDRPDTEELGAVRIRDIWSSYPSSNLTPQKLASILRDADAGHIERQSELATEIEEKHPQIASTLQTRKLAIQELEWDVQPASDSAADEGIADLVRAQLTDLDLTGSIFDLMDATFKGFSASEIQWKLENNQARVSGLEYIPQKRFSFAYLDRHWDERLPKLPQLLIDDLTSIELPPFKVVYHRSNARSGFTPRTGLFRTLVWMSLFWNFTIKDWMIFLEKYGQPMRLGKFTAGAGSKDIEVLKEAVQALGSDAGAVISDTTMLEILEAKGTSSTLDLYERASKYFDGAVSKVVLGQTASTEGTPGNLGSEQERSEVRQDLKKADARALSKTIRDQLIWPIVGFNFGWDIPLPSFEFVIDEPEDLQAKSQVYRTLVEIGVPVTVRQAHEEFGIRPAEDDEPIIQPALAAFPFGALVEDKKKVPVGSRLVPSGVFPVSKTASKTKQTD